MINEIEIKDFKGIEDSITIHLPNDSNLLLCGENGSGKVLYSKP